MNGEQPQLPPREAPPLIGHVRELDGVRGIAIILVMVSHFADSANIPAAAPRIAHIAVALARQGSLGVDLFFALSGYLITGILLHSVQRPDYYRRFYIRRTLRIFPLYYGALFVVCGALPLVLGGRAVNALLGIEYPGSHWQLWLLLYGGNIYLAAYGHWALGLLNHLWSLAVEEQFYFVWPWFVKSIPRRRLLLSVVGVFFGSVALRFVWLRLGLNGLATYVLFRWDGLAVGAVLAIVRSTDTARWMALLSRAKWIFALSLLAAIVTLRGTSQLSVATQHAYTSIVFAVVVASALPEFRSRALKAVFGSEALVRIGKISYGLYVVHVPIAYAVLPRVWRALRLPRGSWNGPSFLLTWAALGFLICYVVASASFTLWEKRFLDLKDQARIR